MVDRGLAPSRARAQAMIAEGAVSVNGRVSRRAATAVHADTAIAVVGPVNPFVSRGGLKLAHALDTFGMDPRGAVALDLGASTGGFTDVLLRRGAARVVAVDVGHGQLNARIAGDPRVVVLERTDARALTRGQAGMPGIVVADMSFVSLTKVLGPALALAAPCAQLVALVKPQFELDPSRIGKGGIVRDPGDRELAVRRVEAFLRDGGWRVSGVTDSPIAGGDGNREFLLHAIRPDAPPRQAKGKACS